MSVTSYNKAIGLLKDNDESPLVCFPATDKQVDDLQEFLGVRLPASYKAMLGNYGILMFMGQTIYGIGKNGVVMQGGSGVLFQTIVARERESISPTMVRIMSSGYGPEVCIECAELDENQEAPVYLVPPDGNLSEAEHMADSFGDFLLAEIKMNLDHAE